MSTLLETIEQVRELVTGEVHEINKHGQIVVTFDLLISLATLTQRNIKPAPVNSESIWYLLKPEGREDEPAYITYEDFASGHRRVNLTDSIVEELESAAWAAQSNGFTVRKGFESVACTTDAFQRHIDESGSGEGLTITWDDSGKYFSLKLPVREGLCLRCVGSSLGWLHLP